MVRERGFQAEVRALLRDRLLDAAADITCAEGWAAVTMSRIAERVGVSRQSVHKEVGTKQALGEALVTREADRFLDGIETRLREHPGDPVTGVASAVEYTLRTGADNPLLKAILAAPHPGADELLPLLATRPEPVLRRAVTAVLGYVRQQYPELAERDPGPLVDAVVRLTLSHLAQPLGPAEDAIAQVRRIAGLWLSA
ncbi:TetR/AcrR family transcriptional regulator [Prauserella shujinwangii]|uniref:TetR/AcrR family transcriptional regulator n=1 Tax=Prauserella shujinwangii TaxID=1453103 RepID=UPI001FED1EAF|nr:TetR family transcriptional regulator [Prauserella shujinwangii]